MSEYMRRLLLAQANGVIPAEGVWDTRCAHDVWCGVYKRQDCNCDPEITLQEVVGKNRVIGIDKNGNAKAHH